MPVLQACALPWMIGITCVYDYPICTKQLESKKSEKIENTENSNNNQGVDSEELLESAAYAGDAQAQFELGNEKEYAARWDEEQDESEAVAWWRKAAEQGHVRAQAKLGKSLLYGYGSTVERDAARRWLTRAAEAGNEAASTELVKLDKLEGLLASVALGHTDAMFALGNAYNKGEAVKRNPQEAVSWWLKAASGGSTQAQIKLAMAYENGEGVAQDKFEAARWWRKAAEQGDVAAQVHLGTVLLYGKGLPVDLGEAKVWLGRASEVGSERAKEELRKLTELESLIARSESGDTRVLIELGEFFDGAGNQTEAVRWWRKAAEHGNNEGMVNLADAYRYGKSVEKDMRQAISLYEHAAQSGAANAAYRLGWLYENGTEIEKNLVAAWSWYSIAEARYLRSGMERREVVRDKKHLRESMTKDQVESAERLAHKWLEAHPQQMTSMSVMGH